MCEFYFAVIILGNVQNMKPVQNICTVVQLYTLVLSLLFGLRNGNP